MAPVVHELKKHREFQVQVALSAQHRGMLDQVMKLFGIRSDADLNLMKPGQTLTDITAGVLHHFEPVLKRLKPDMVLVHGDTTTTLGGSLAAYYQKIPVGHVEAGLRTNDMFQPFPEEMNRRLTDAITTLYFAPTSASEKNLQKENLNRSHISITGNTVIDALLIAVKKKKKYSDKKLKNLMATLQKNRNRIILMTAHRRENFGAPFAEAFGAISTLLERFPDVHWIYPVHPNPNVHDVARRVFSGKKNMHLFAPLDYSDLVQIMNASTLVVTDSGGLQEEAPSLGKPVLVLRNVTERPEAVTAGTVRLVGTSRRKIIDNVTELLTKPSAYKKMSQAVNPYGDGKASQRIAAAIKFSFKLSKKSPQPFSPKK